MTARPPSLCTAILSRAARTACIAKAKGAMDIDLADEIWGWDQSTDGYAYAWLFDSDGTTPSLDGKWLDGATGLETTMILSRGTGWWYFSKADTRTSGWTWTEPVPY